MKRFPVAVIVASLILLCAASRRGDLAMAQPAPPKPKLSIKYDETPEKVLPLLGIEVPTIPGFACDIWCYEQAFDNRQRGETEMQADGSMILTHKLGPTTVRSHIVPGIIDASDAGGVVAYVDFFITISGGTAEQVREISSLNACWQMRRAEGFKSEGDYVKDFANQCFMFTEKGLTMLSETTRFPDTRRPLDDRVNTPPWVQNYPPVWLRHRGQSPGSRGIGVDRPIYTLAGEISRDGRHLVAWGCRSGSRVGQVWHDCLHLSPNVREEYDEAANVMRARWRFYFMENDPDRLLRMYLADIKPTPPAVSVNAEDDDGPISVTSSNLPGQAASLDLRVVIDGQVAVMDAAQKWEKQLWGAVTGGGSGPKSRYYVWANPVDEHVDLVVTVANTSQELIEARVESRLELGDRAGLAAAGGVAGVLWEGESSSSLTLAASKDLGKVVAPGKSRTLRGRVHFAKSTPADLEQVQADDLTEWSLAVPFKRALPE
jgi:hypothetical protein